MYSPTTRLLTVLELLQSQGSISGPALAEKLEVDVRSVRRYITMLRDLGIPVESEPGRYGTYALRPGFRLPPLMFTNTEMLAIILGLIAVRHLGLSSALGIESVTAKIERVLPAELRERVRAVQGVLTLDLARRDSTTPEEMIARVSLAAYQHTQIWMAYQPRDRDLTERVVDVYGLVYHTGYWYAVGYCHLRRDKRIFRLDRVMQLRLLDTPFTPPDQFDALRHLWESIASIPGTYEVQILLETTLPDAQARVPPDMATLEAVEGGVLMRCYTENFEWLAYFLVGLRCPLRVLAPEGLRDTLKGIAQSILAMT